MALQNPAARIIASARVTADYQINIRTTVWAFRNLVSIRDVHRISLSIYHLKLNKLIGMLLEASVLLGVDVNIEVVVDKS